MERSGDGAIGAVGRDGGVGGVGGVGRVGGAVGVALDEGASGPGVGESRAASTRELILDTAERLFAEHGVRAVSNRRISEAAGQGNNAAVGYHVGTRTDLVRAITRRHAEPIEAIRCRFVAAAERAPTLRAWVDCMVRPLTEHLAAPARPTWFARFNAQAMTDPEMRAVIAAESRESGSLDRMVAGFAAALPELPPEVRRERADMARLLVVHMCAEREHALADGAATPRADWDATATGMIDALLGLWLAPVSPTPRAR